MSSHFLNNTSNHKTVWKKDWCEHTRKLYGGRNVYSVQEFNWVILLNKKAAHKHEYGTVFL